MIPVKYINENRDTHEIKFSTYILMIVMTIILVLALASKCHATPYQEQPYNAPPRLFKNCMESYIPAKDYGAYGHASTSSKN